jgi:glycosyltransferase involved in cell wall biosynthesis
MAGEKQLINCINYNGDDCACGFYRMHFPMMGLKTVLGGEYRFKFLESENPILDAGYYQSLQNLRVIRIQRWFQKHQAEIVKKFLRPLCDKLGIWLVYEIDDVLLYDEIPKYNLAREHFSPERIENSVQEIFDCCDLITVTTEELKQIYVEKLNQRPGKVLVIPNYLPRWWIGESFNLMEQLKQFDEQRKKPHIAFACSTNHFDILNANNGVDDFTEIMPWIKKNLDKYQFIFVGGVPQQLHEEVKSGKIHAQPPSDLMNYPREIRLRKIDLLIAPLINSRFNQCKSNIKWLEMSALGVPMIGQNICTYNKYTDQVFSNTDDIDNWIEKLFFKGDSRDFYANLIIKNRKIVDGNEKESGYWLERNLKSYYDLYSIPQNTVTLDI